MKQGQNGEFVSLVWKRVIAALGANIDHEFFEMNEQGQPGLVKEEVIEIAKEIIV